MSCRPDVVTRRVPNVGTVGRSVRTRETTEFADSCVRLRLLVVVSSTPFRYLLVLQLGRSDRRTVLIVADV